jgi:hypothetical protein
MDCRQISNEEAVDLPIPFMHHVQSSQIKQLFTNWVNMPIRDRKIFHVTTQM